MVTAWHPDLAKRAEVYGQLRPYLWCAVDRRSGEAHPRCYNVQPEAPFHWYPDRPSPTYRGCSDRFGLFAAAGLVPDADRDFPNPDVEWGHPTFEAYMRAYAYWDEIRQEA